MHRSEAAYWGRIDFIYIDRENPDNEQVVRQYGIVYQPVFVLIEADGREIARWFYFDEGTIHPALDEFLAGR